MSNEELCDLGALEPLGREEEPPNPGVEERCLLDGSSADPVVLRQHDPPSSPHLGQPLDILGPFSELFLYEPHVRSLVAEGVAYQVATQALVDDENDVLKPRS